MNPILKRVIGIVLPVASIGLSFLTDKWEERKLEDKIAKKVSEALSKAKES